VELRGGEYLANSAPAEIATLFPALDAILVEAFQGDRWLILAPSSAEPELADAGFRAAHEWE
jgi:hypothetical protein